MTMTPAEVVAEMKSDSLLNKVRQALTNHHATIEAASNWRRPPGIIAFRNMEFDAARELIALIRDHDAAMSAFKHDRPK